MTERIPTLPRRQLLAAGGLAALGLSGRPAFAQDMLKQLTIIVGSPAGGATDKMARMYADALRGRYADNVIVENKPGAGGAIAYEGVKRSGVKDGSLVFLSPAYPIVISPHLVRNLPYDTLNDFVPVAPAGRSCMTYAVGPGVPASVTRFADYLAWCKENPRLALYAAQTGSSQHLMGSVLALSTGVPLENVSYKGDAPAMQDLLGGHVPAVVLPIASALPLYRQGKIRVLATAKGTRTRFMPDIPTFTEMGYQDVLFQDWLGVFAPADTAPAQVRRLNESIAQVARSPRGIEALENLGIEAELASPDVFAGMVRTDHQRYAGFIERTRFREAFEKAGGGR
jgi:tripartite-type tricarboxylate transporter receptor subunit TctC